MKVLTLFQFFSPMYILMHNQITCFCNYSCTLYHIYRFSTIMAFAQYLCTSFSCHSTWTTFNVSTNTTTYLQLYHQYQMPFPSETLSFLCLSSSILLVFFQTTLSLPFLYHLYQIGLIYSLHLLITCISDNTVLPIHFFFYTGGYRNRRLLTPVSRLIVFLSHNSSFI